MTTVLVPRWSPTIHRPSPSSETRVSEPSNLSAAVPSTISRNSATPSWATAGSIGVGRPERPVPRPNGERWPPAPGVEPPHRRCSGAPPPGPARAVGVGLLQRGQQLGGARSHPPGQAVVRGTVLGGPVGVALAGGGPVGMACPHVGGPEALHPAQVHDQVAEGPVGAGGNRQRPVRHRRSGPPPVNCPSGWLCDQSSMVRS